MLLLLLAPAEAEAADSQKKGVEAINVVWSDDRAVILSIDGYELHFEKRDSALLNMPVEQDIIFEVRVTGMDHVFKEMIRITSGTERIVLRLNKSEDEGDGDDELYRAAENYELKISQQIMPVMIGGVQSLYENLTYPRSAIRRNLEGITRIGFIVNAEGRVENARVEVSSGHNTLDRAAIQAVERLRFEPGTADGYEVNVKMTQPVVFRLQ